MGKSVRSANKNHISSRSFSSYVSTLRHWEKYRFNRLGFRNSPLRFIIQSSQIYMYTIWQYTFAPINLSAFNIPNRQALRA
jgi:hypothetical protein